MARSNTDKVADYYAAQYLEIVGKRPVFARAKATWVFRSILQDYSLEETKTIVLHFIKYFPNHREDIKWFEYNYDVVLTHYTKHTAEEATQKRLRQESMDRVRQWEAQVERIKSNSRHTT